MTNFKPGDTVSVGVKVTEGNRSRVQLFDGVVIAQSAGAGTSKTFTVRKISNGGWKRSLFGDSGMHGAEGVRFYTKLKTITSRWPSGIRSNPEFVMPTMK